MTTNTKCYNCVLNPETCLYRCGLTKEDCDYLMHNKGVKLALHKAVKDWTDLVDEILTLELELNTLIELGITDADYQDITSLLHAGYEIINSKCRD